jgi:glutathione peroxidase-family protein
MAVLLYEIPLRRIDGSPSRLADYRGEVVARFSPDVTADDPRLVSAIDEELANGA